MCRLFGLVVPNFLTQSPTYLSALFILSFIYTTDRSSYYVRVCSTCWDMAVVQATLAFGSFGVPAPSPLALPHTCAVTTPASCEAASSCLPKASTAPFGCKFLLPDKILLYFFKKITSSRRRLPRLCLAEPTPLLTLESSVMFIEFKCAGLGASS